MPTYETLVVLFSNSGCEVCQKDCRGKEKESTGFLPYISVGMKLREAPTITLEKKGTSRIRQNDRVFLISA